MKKLTTIILVLLLAAPVAAKDISAVGLLRVSNVSATCGFAFEANGCYRYDTKTIYLNQHLTGTALALTFWHEYGHFFMADVSLEEYRRVLDVNASTPVAFLPEIAANYIALRAMGLHPAGLTPAIERLFVTSILN